MWFKSTKILLVLTISLLGMIAKAEEKTESNLYFGIGGGYHMSTMSISHLNKDIYPDSKRQGSGMFDIFLQYEFGLKKEFGIRLELDFLKRGGSLQNIYNSPKFENFYETENIRNIKYHLQSRFVDIRLPLIYQFCGSRNIVRPYLYLAPIVSFSTGGRISAQTDFSNGTYEGMSLPITKGNFRSVNFAGAIGAGLKYDLDIKGHPFYISVEVNYQLGFSDTYSSKEKDGSAVVKDNVFNYIYDNTGTRRFNGFEFKGSLSIPFSVFKKKKEHLYCESIQEDPIPVPAVPKPTVEIENKIEQEDAPCRSIEEVIDMIEQGTDIHGVVFCSIDDIRFETGKSTLQTSSYMYLNKLAAILKQTGMNIEVKGHTDNTGSHEVNMKLSRNRAEAVVNYLKRSGVAENQLSFSYYGETCPLSDNSTESGRSVNRRVEFEIK
ncbi:MAG: OmpA family protein [Muribaculaceae bacterium]|nr:OmpA family protein [Muribaculaceae bacterium]